MKKRFPELAKAKTVHFRRNNKDWYVLLQGQFKNSREAIQAIKDPELRQAMLVSASLDTTREIFEESADCQPLARIFHKHPG